MTNTETGHVASAVHAGMTLRDWFAGQALAHLGCENILRLARSEEECALQFTNAAAFCYRIADALLAARGTGREG